MKYIPAIASENPIRQFQVGKYSAVLLDDIESAGVVEYRFILVVYDDTEQPCYFVASEVNNNANTFGGGSHFLGLFDGNGHASCGSSDDWADESKFTAEALRIVQESFEV
jgi:hypothetical protein